MIGSPWAKKACPVPGHWFVFVVIPAAASHHQFLRAIFERAVSDDRLTHILALPIVAAVLLWLDAEDGYQLVGGRRTIAGLMAAAGASAGIWGGKLFTGEIGPIAQFTLLLIAISLGFVFFYGWEMLRKRRFAFFVLALSVPLPEATLMWFETFLQRQSANVAEVFFRLIRISYLRQGTVFSLPGMVIEVARECSGVRSALAILAATVIGSRVALQGPIGRTLLCASAIPIAIAKNAVRITVLAGLGVWVSPDVLLGPLHRYGGPVFSVVTVLLFVPLVLGLQRLERWRRLRRLERIEVLPVAQ